MCAAAVALGVAGGGCGGSAAPPRAPAPPAEQPPQAPPREAAQDEGEAPSGPRFSQSSVSPSVSLFTLHYAIATAIRAHPSGDVVLTGCTEGPTDLRPDTEDRRVLAFVARVDPRTGRARWVRHLDLAPIAFENACRVSYQPVYPGPRAHATTHLGVGAEGHVYVSAFGLDPAPYAPVEASVAPGAVVLSLNAEDGSIRWQHHVGAPAELAVVTHLVASDGGVDALVRRHASDGLDAHVLVHLDADGHASERASLRVAAMPSRRTPCHHGAGGCRVEVEWLARAEDGSLTMYGTFAGVELLIGGASIRSQPNGIRSDAFWASLEPDGALRWLRASPQLVTTIVRARDHEVVAAVGERVARIATETGARSPWSRTGAEPAWPVSRALRIHEEQRLRLAGATITHPNGERALAPPASSGALTPELLRSVQRADPEGQAPQVVELPDGSLAAIVMLHGRMQIGSQTASSAHRMVRCHPGPVGEERSQPPGCREPLERPAAVLMILAPRT